jgi:hypothetical protein
MRRLSKHRCLIMAARLNYSSILISLFIRIKFIFHQVTFMRCGIEVWNEQLYLIISVQVSLIMVIQEKKN